jgi:hypothetical protein
MFNYIVEYHCLIFLKIGIFMLINLFQNNIKLMFLICLYIFLTTVSYHDDFVHNLHCLVEHFRVFKAIQPVQIPVASFYNIGDRKTNIIHTKLRHRCSGLNAYFDVKYKNNI